MPPLKDPRGSVTFRIEDGVLTEFTLAIERLASGLTGNEIKLDRTATTKISDVGTAKVEVPDDAREIVEALIAGRKPDVFVPEPGFRKLFDGRSLAGWEGRPGSGRWKTGPSSAGPPRTTRFEGNTFLFAKSGRQEPDRRRLRAAPLLPDHRGQRPRLRQLGHPVPQPRPGRLRRGRLPGGHGGRPDVLGHPLRRGRRRRRPRHHGHPRREGHLDLRRAARR